WFYGDFNGGATAPAPSYSAAAFVPFPRAGGPPGTNNLWDGASWDWWNGNPPFDEIGQYVMNPNGLNSGNIHWVIRRWVSKVSGTLTVDYKIEKLVAGGAGVTVRIFRNGAQRDTVTLPGTNATVVARSIDISGVQVGDFIDIALDPMGSGTAFGDGGDRCLVTAVLHGHPSLTSQIAGNLEGLMRNVNASAFIRIPFEVTDPSAIQFLTLRMKYDDGFIAYLNGSQVASANAPPLSDWNSAATASRSDAAASEYEEFDLTAARGVLQVGADVLASRGLNASSTESNVLIFLGL